MTDNSLSLAKEIFLAPMELTETKLEQILGEILGNTIDSADLYFQLATSESISLEDGIIKQGNYALDKGLGVRAISGEQVGFAYTSDLILPAVQQACLAAKSIAINNNGTKPIAIKFNQNTTEQISRKSLYPTLDPLHSLTMLEKIDLLRKIDQHARKLDPRIIQVITSLAASYEIIFMLTSDGNYAVDLRPLVRLNVSVVAEQHGQREQGIYGGGSRGSYQMFLTDNLGLSFAEQAVRSALINLSAIAAPAGTMPVVLGPGWPGVLLHEAIGHGLEGDFNRKQTSAFSGKLGEKIASSSCTIVDDGTLLERRGSLQIDDEGTPTSYTVLIENGILKGYMQDKLNAKLMGVKSTGNGRRESYAYPPLPRMTNTYMLPGKYDPEEIISSVQQGIYAVNFGGGQVDITSGKFVFNASEAYLIKQGKITQPIKGATLIGNGPDILTKVSMIGNDLKLDPGIGVCGKDGQSVPVGVGQPTILVDEITVGGTN